MAEPEFQMGGGHPDPEITGGGQSQKSFVWPFRPWFGLKEGGAFRSLGPLPWVRY